MGSGLRREGAWGESDDRAIHRGGEATIRSTGGAGNAELHVMSLRWSAAVPWVRGTGRVGRS